MNYNGDPLAVNGIYGAATFTDGVATLQLAHGETAEIVGLPHGATYTVAETANDHYTTTMSGDSGAIEAGEIATAAFTNTHTLGDLEITKTVVPVEGYDLTVDQETKVFEFTVTLDPVDGVTLASSYACVKNGVEGTQEVLAVEDSDSKTFTVQLKHGETFRIKGLPIGTNYTVVESADSDYEVSKTGDTGAIIADNAETADVGEAAKAAFINTHKPGQLKVTKQIIVPKDAVMVADDGSEVTGGTQSNIPEELTRVFTFTVTLTPDTSSGKYFTLPGKVSYVKTDAYGNAITGELNLTALGNEQQQKTCTFTLMSGEGLVIVGLRPGTQYSVSEAVEDGYIRTRSYLDQETPYIIDAGKTDTVAFTNTYSPNTLTIEKVIKDAKGDVIDKEHPAYANVADDIFAFEVTLPKGEYTLVDQKNNPTLLTFDDENTTRTVSVIGPGEVYINGIPIGYNYTVKEVGMENGYAYASVQPYMYTDPDGDGTYAETEDTRGIVDTTTVSQGVKSEISYKGNRAEFTNTYTTGELEISKTVVGTDAPEGDEADNFGFTVNFYIENAEDPVEGEEAPVKEAQDGTFACVITDEKGNVVANSISQITNGVGVFNLKRGWKATISDIPTGTYYEVTEAVNSNYTMTKTGDTGTISNEKSYAAFTNTYGYGSLIVTKTFSDGVVPEDGDTFLFKVMQGEELIAEIVMSGKDIKNGKNSVTLSPLPLGTYTVTEDTSWSWRYTAVGGASKDAEVTATTNPEVVFENNKKTDKWIGSVDYEDNDYMGQPS